jgi:cytochrome c5
MNHKYLMAVVFSVTMTAALADAPETPDMQKSLPIPGESTPRKKPSAPTPEIAPTRGQMLYENHCTRCHESTVHIREARRATSIKALESWVIRWSDQQQLDWGPGEVRDVVDYLNRRYYKFPPSSGVQ